jgi:hypothetical protein
MKLMKRAGWVWFSGRSSRGVSGEMGGSVIGTEFDCSTPDLCTY